jgi:hypothetical protein
MLTEVRTPRNREHERLIPDCLQRNLEPELSDVIPPECVHADLRERCLRECDFADECINILLAGLDSTGLDSTRR